MPQPQPWGPVTTTKAQIMLYLGFNKALKKWGLGKEGSILQGLKWQKDVNRNTKKIMQFFQDVIRGLQDF